MSEEYKKVTVKNHEYRISRFSARDGAYVMPKVTGLLAPIIDPLVKGLDLKKVASKPEDIDIRNFDLAALLGPLARIPEDDFMYLQEKCMKVCAVRMPSGYQPVVYDNGSFSLPDLEHDWMSVLALMGHAIMHNFADFFGEVNLKGWFTGLSATNLQN